MIGDGLRPALSSDAPATSWEDAANAWLGVSTAITRQTWAGSVLGAGEAISVAEALAAYSVNGAAALGVEDQTGSIDIGKNADLMVLPDDPLALSGDRWRDHASPATVLLRGRVVHGAWP